MRIVHAPVMLLAMLICVCQAQAAGMVIGVVAPKSGNFATLGSQIINGADQQIRADGNKMVLVDETCEDNSGAAVAETLIKEKVAVAIGFLCSETLEGALPRLKDAAIPAITVSVRSRILMEDALKNNWPLLRLAPTDADEAKKIIEIIMRDWASSPTALVDDGTVHARELVDAIRNALEARGLKPIVTDNFRPGQDQQIGLVRRLKRAGASKVFVAGDRRDISIIVRDAKSEKLSLDFLSGDAMRAADQPVPLADGFRAVVLPDGDAVATAKDFVSALRAQGLEPEGYTLAAASAATLASQAAAKGGMSLLTSMIGASFHTPLGEIRFAANHELSDNPYQLMEWQDGAFKPVQEPTQ
ncbi:ABC transporter substrate-binding protein [Oryzifoliimicrobium ureilyticus]|uniref:ABC transporter substrate-binding protein n=1 Tax=Oryzifoliimicrobium ureilyticus TaxID=3113724 RepID=UPI003F6746C0